MTYNHALADPSLIACPHCDLLRLLWPHRRTEPVQGGSYDGLAAHSRALAKLSGDISAAIRAAEQSRGIPRGR